MSPLGNRLISKLNGLGNAIMVLDLRGQRAAVSGAEARAIARGDGLSFDQLMVLKDPLGPGADAFVTIYNNDGSQAGTCARVLCRNRALDLRCRGHRVLIYRTTEG